MLAQQAPRGPITNDTASEMSAISESLEMTLLELILEFSPISVDMLEMFFANVTWDWASVHYLFLQDLFGDLRGGM